MKLRDIRAFLFDTLRGRLILGVALVHAVMMTLFIIDVTMRQRAMLLDRQREDATALSLSLSTSAAIWLAADDIAGLQELVEAQRRYPELVYAILADKGGRILAHTDESRRGQFLLDLPKDVRQSIISETPALVDVAAPAILGGRHVGWARVGTGQKAAGEKLAEIALAGVLYALAAILIGSVIAWLLGRRITRRLYSIQDTMNEVRAGNSLARSHMKGADEPALLAREFNVMLDAVSERGAELRRSDKRLNEAQRIAHIGHWELDLVSKVLCWSEEIYRIFEIDRASFGASYEAFLDAIHPEDRPGVNAAYTNSVKSRMPYETDHRLLFADGRVKFVRERGETYYDQDGSPLRTLGTVQDITERKRAEGELRESYTRFQLVLDSLDALVYVADMTSYEVLFLNRYGREKRGAAVGKTCWQTLQSGQAGPCPFCTNSRLVLPSGEAAGPLVWEFQNTVDNHWYECRDQAIRWPDGRLVRMEIASDITERKQLEGRLVQQSKTLDSFFKCTITPLAILDRHFNFIRVNEAYARACQRDVSEFPGHNHFEFYPSDAKKIFEEVVETKSPYQATARPFFYPDHPEWDVTYWDWTLTPILSDTGEVEFLVFSLKDVTKLKQADEKLQGSERMMSILNRIANVFLTVPDEEVYGEVLSVVLDVMESRFGIFGFIADNGDLVLPSLSREVWSECQIPDKSIVFPPHAWGGSLWGRAIREKVAFYSNNSSHTPGGHVHIDNFLAVPILFGGNTIGLLSVANKDGGYTEENKELQESIANRISPILNARMQRDSLERQRADAERTLKSLAHRMSLILNSVGEGIYGTDLDGKVTFANPAAARMLGYEVKELIGREGHATWHHSYPDGTPFPIEQCRLHQVLRQGIPCVTSSGVFLRKNGTKFPVDCNSTPMLEADKLVGAVVIFRDIDEKTQLENQLRQAQKMEAVGILAGGVAHDYNNLTTIILAYADMLLGGLPPDGPDRKYVDQIVKAGERSAALTRQLLAFSRKQPLLPKVLDLSALLLDYEKMLGRLIGEDIQLEFKLAADAGCVTADQGQLEQIVTNLVINARDAMPRGGRLTIETTAVELDEMQAPGTEKVIPGSYVKLTVTDTGAGMDKATLARIFEPFFTTKEKGKGTGLGLATAYGILKQVGGYIWAASEPGKGTTFTIHLPRTGAKPLVVPIRGVEDAPCGGNGERVLLVEDEAALREWCKTALTRLGYRVSAAANGQEALNLVREQGFEPELIVTDLVMPEMSGFELADRLREKRPDLGVLYMSGYPDEVIARHGVIAPDTFFLPKPFSEHDLAAKAHEVLAATGTGGRSAVRPGRRVLMIDDDEQYREMVRHFCTKRGHVLAGVDSTVAALAALAAQPCDVLLVDLNIPGTSGEHVLREIRAAGYAAPAIVLTGEVASADMDALRPLGVLRALEKSSNAVPLLRAIEEESLA